MNLRRLELKSIRDFVQYAADEEYLHGRVLDYGCGQQPYRDIVEAADGEYVGYDRADNPGSVSGIDVGDLERESPEEGTGFNAILCTQVVQYVSVFELVNGEFFNFLKWLIVDNGYLVMTYGTNWPEVEKEDFHRHTKAGMEMLLTEAGFTIVQHHCRGMHPGTDLALGYGVIARV